MLCLPAPSMFAYFSSELGNGGQPFSRLLRKTAITKHTVMLLVCLVWAAEFGVPGLFLPGKFRASRDEWRLRAIEKVFIPLSPKVKTKIMDWGLLPLITVCKVDSVPALLVYARLDEIDWSDSATSGCYVYDFTAGILFAVQEWKVDGARKAAMATHFMVWCTRRLLRDKSRIFNFRKSGMERELFEEDWSCFKTEGLGLKVMPSIKENAPWCKTWLTVAVKSMVRRTVSTRTETSTKWCPFMGWRRLALAAGSRRLSVYAKAETKLCRRPLSK